MNFKEYWEAVHSGANIREYDLKSREIQKSLKYNSDPNAIVRHHLMDTPEQIEYNTSHYEMWGHNLDGIFEYGKYMIFVTKEEHRKIHDACAETKRRMRASALRVWKNKEHRIKMSKLRKGKTPWNKGIPCSDEVKQRLILANSGRITSDETRRKLSEASTNMWKDPVIRAKIINSLQGHEVSEETRRKISEANSGENHYLYGKHISEETRRKMGESRTGEKNPMYGKRGENSPIFGIKRSEETKKKMSDAQKLLYSSGKRESLKGENNPNYGKHLSDEAKKKISDAKSGTRLSEEHKKKIGDSVRGPKNGRYGKHCTDEQKSKIRSTLLKVNSAKRYIYNVYKENGGSLPYKEFFIAVKAGDIGFYNYSTCYSV